MAMATADIPLPDAQWCTRCIMNSSVDPEIEIGTDGICHHCRRYDAMVATRTIPVGQREQALAAMVDRIKAAGRGKAYDCVVGVSGGVDSTYVALLAKKLGLRPLAVHLDNGWNSELAVANIEKTMNSLEIDLHTRVLDWSEFKELQLAFLRSSTPDGEIPTDHAIFATLWKEAAHHNIHFILSGMNFATESISVPNWSYGHSDWKYIKAINGLFGHRQLKTYPHFTILDLLWINAVKGVRTVSILNYIDYDKSRAMAALQHDLGWQYYGGKHYESIYTRFWQGYVLPRKFGIDKRYGHLSDLINSGQMTREAALVEAGHDPYPSPEMREQDKKYVYKKLGLTEAEFDEVMAQRPRSFREFPNSYQAVHRLKRVANWLRSKHLYPK
jgi:N-acetyl sugar amidotransferase